MVKSVAPAVITPLMRNPSSGEPEGAMVSLKASSRSHSAMSLAKFSSASMLSRPCWRTSA